MTTRSNPPRLHLPVTWKQHWQNNATPCFYRTFLWWKEYNSLLQKGVTF